MRFETLELTNWGPFLGEHKIDLRVTDDSPVLILYGENGKGKSSVSKAIEFCLFGRFLDDSKKIALFPNWTMARQGDVFPVVVKLTFSVEQDDAEEGTDERVLRYELTRTFQAVPVKGGTSPESHIHSSEAQLRIDGGNPERESLIPNIVRRFMPFDIAKFFLFDGEQFNKLQAELDHGVTTMVKDEIHSVMGLPAIKFLKETLEREYQRLNKTVTAQIKHKDKAKKLAELEDALKRKKDSLSESKRQIATVRDESERLLEELQRNEGAQEAVATIKVLTDDKKTHEAKLSALKEGCKREFQDVWWVPIAERIVASQSTESSRATKFAATSALRARIDLIQEVVANGKCNVCEQKVHETSALEAQLESLKLEFEKVSTDEAVPFFTQHFSDVNVRKISLLHSLNAVAVTSNDLRKIENAIAIQEVKLQGADEESISQKATQLSANKKREGILTSGIETMEADILDDEKNVNKRRKELTGNSGESGLVQDKLVLINQIQEVLSDLESSFVKLVRREVAERSSMHYSYMMDNADIAGISIDDNFQIRAIHKTLGEKPMSSAGQSVIYAYAFIAALIDVSGNEGPWLIDTIGGRLDATRISSVWQWLSTLKRQVIALPHSGELTPERARIFLGSSIAREFRIDSVPGASDASSEIREMH